MAELSAADRDKLPDSAFAIVKTVDGKKVRQYPIDTRARAADALSRVSQFGTPADKETVQSAVCKAYPDMGICAARKIAGKLQGK